MPRFSKKPSALVLAIAAVFVPATLAARSINPQQQLEDLEAATSLDHPGMAPWHLRMSFQLYDLDGKPSDKGTIEEWWVSPQEQRIVVASPSYNATLPSPPDAPLVASRTAYLIDLLIGQIVQPVPDYKSLQNFDIERSKQKLNKVELACLTLQNPPLMQPGSAANRFARASSDALALPPQEPLSSCVEPGTNILRAQFRPTQNFLYIRDQLATFRSVEIAIDNGIFFGNRLAISGHIETLQSYTPTPAEVAAAAARSQPGNIIPGKLLNPANPNFTGDSVVVLFIAISKSGTVDSVAVIYRSSKDAADAWLDLAKHWKYRPFLRNGKPMAARITTTLRTGFSMVGG